MKHSWLMIMLTAGWSATAVADLDLPKRKPGLWEIKMEMAGMPRGMNSSQCIDEKTDAEMLQHALSDQDMKCDTMQFKQTGQGYESDFHCTNKHGTTTGHSVITGDMNSAYTMQNDIKLDPPQHGKKEMHQTSHFTYAGACPEGMKPGDMKVNGMNISKETLESTMKAGGKIKPEDLKKMMEMLKQHQH